MTKYLFALLTALLISCGKTTPNDATKQAIAQNQLLFKKGDCLAFKIDSLTYGVGIIFDFSGDKDGMWYCLLFTDYESINKPTIDLILDKRFLGRKIENSSEKKGYQIMLDGAFVPDSLMTGNFELVGNISLNNNGRLGEQGPISKMERFIQAYKNGKQRRLTLDKYRVDLIGPDKFRRDEYFDLKNFVKIEKK